MKLIEKCIPALLLLSLTSVLHAQNRNTIGANFTYGSTIFSAKGAYKGVGINYNISTANNHSEWAELLNVENIIIDVTLYNMNGISGSTALTAFNPKFSNQGYFGNHLALSGGIDIRLINVNGFKVLLSPAVGVLYSDKDYLTTGGVNQVMGSRLNAISSAKLKLMLPVTYNTQLVIGAGIAHCSNSNTSRPNVGLNKIESFIGVTHALSSANVSVPKFKLGQNPISVELVAGYTGQITTGFYQLKNVNLQLDKTFRRSTKPIVKAAITASYTHYLNNVMGLKVGADIVYSSKTSPLGSATSDTTKFMQTFQGDYTPVNSNFNVGLNAGMDLRMGRVVFSGSYGYYLGKYERYIYKPGGNRFEYGRMFYSTLSAKYFISPNLAVGVKSYLNNFAGIGIHMAI